MEKQQLKFPLYFENGSTRKPGFEICAIWRDCPVQSTYSIFASSWYSGNLVWLN